MNNKYGGEKKSARNTTQKVVKSSKNVSKKAIKPSKKEERKNKFILNPVVIDPIKGDPRIKYSEKWDTTKNLDAVEAFELVYGFHPNVNLTYKEDNFDKIINKETARDWWEKASGIQMQCNNSIGKFMKGETKCYICGFGINEGDVTPECEHILPVFKASLYLTLYNDDYKEIMKKGKSEFSSLTSKEKTIYNEIQLEYDWAHRCCNQKKSDIDFIKFNNETKKFVLDNDNTQLIFTQIINAINNDPIYEAKNDNEDGDRDTKRNHCGGDKSLREGLIKLSGNNLNINNKKIKDWIKERMDILQSNEKVGKIIKYLNNNKELNQELFTLVSLCNLISAADMNDIFFVWSKLGQIPPLKNIPPIEQLTKATVMKYLSEILNDLSKFSWGRELNEKKYDLYKKMFDIPDNIKIELRRDGNFNITEAILGSILYINKSNKKISKFYRNFYSIICYNTLKNNKILFPDEKGKIYASNLVGQAFIIFYFIKIINIIKSDTVEMKNVLYKQFLNKFELQLTKEIEKMNTINNNYYKDINYNPSENKKTPYYTFIILFMEFIKMVDSELPTELLLNELMNTQDELKDLLSEENKSINEKIIDEYFSPEKKSENKLSNLDNAVILYYIDSYEKLKSYPEWNLDLDISDDSKLSPSNRLKDIAKASNVLLKIKKDKDELKSKSINNLNMLGEIAEEKMEIEEGAVNLQNIFNFYKPSSRSNQGSRSNQVSRSRSRKKNKNLNK